MAKTCCVCDGKIGAFEGASTWIPGRDDLLICGGCVAKFKEAKRTDVDSGNEYLFRVHLKALDFFAEQMERQSMDEAVRTELSRQLPTAENARVEAEKNREHREKEDKLREAARSDFHITTALSFPGYELLESKGVITADAVVGTGLIADTASALSDLAGAKSNKLADKMKRIKADALDDVTERAIRLGCNCLIGLTYFPCVINGNMMGVSVTATAARIGRANGK